MKRSKFTDSQIVDNLKRVEAGLTIPEVCRELVISTQTQFIEVLHKIKYDHSRSIGRD